MDARNRWIVGGVALLLVVSGIGVSLILSDAEPGDPGSGEPSGAVPITSPDSGPAVETETDPSEEIAGDISLDPNDENSGRPRITQAVARQQATSVRDTPAPPTSGTDSPGSAQPTDPDDGLTAEQRRYLDETRATVKANPTALTTAAGDIFAAMSGSDEGALDGILAADEGPQPDFVSYIADRYPRILESEPGATVNIFASGDATIYMAYALVVWEDGGIVSQHTIPIPMRFVDGEWHLTSVEHWSDSLTFVQSVGL